MTTQHRAIGVRTFCLLGTALALLVAASGSAEETRTLGERQARIFSQICATCHVQPGSGAPLIGHVEDWRERRAGGLERLVRNTVDGYRDMPPLGTCGFCTERDLRLLIAFMLAASTDDDANSRRPR
jgi:cytochrome c5